MKGKRESEKMLKWDPISPRKCFHWTQAPEITDSFTHPRKWKVEFSTETCVIFIIHTLTTKIHSPLHLQFQEIDLKKRKKSKRVSVLDVLPDISYCYYHTERKTSCLNTSPRTSSSEWVRTARWWLPGWPVTAPTGHPYTCPCVQGRSSHQCLKVRGWHRGSESWNPLGGDGGEPRGHCCLAGAGQCTAASAALEADSAPLSGKGMMWREIGKCHCAGVKGDIRSVSLKDTIPFGHQKYLPFL